MTRKGIVVLVISFIFIPVFSPILAQNEAQVPQTLDEAQIRGKSVLNTLPGVLSRLWQELRGYFFQFVNWLIKIWENYIYPPIQDFWNREVESRKPEIEQELQKEKQEMVQDIKTEVPKIGKTVWDRFMELIR